MLPKRCGTTLDCDYTLWIDCHNINKSEQVLPRPERADMGVEFFCNITEASLLPQCPDSTLCGAQPLCFPLLGDFIYRFHSPYSPPQEAESKESERHTAYYP